MKLKNPNIESKIKEIKYINFMPPFKDVRIKIRTIRIPKYACHSAALQVSSCNYRDNNKLKLSKFKYLKFSSVDLAAQDQIIKSKIFNHRRMSLPGQRLENRNQKSYPRNRIRKVFPNRNLIKNRYFLN